MCSCKYIPVAAHIAMQCMGLVDTPDGQSTDITTLLWDKLELSLTTTSPVDGGQGVVVSEVCCQNKYTALDPVMGLFCGFVG